jgi:hypothetical protein
LGVGRKANDLLCKKIIVAKSKEEKIGCNLVESSKEGHGSKRAILPMMMIMKRPKASEVRRKFYSSS